MQRPAAIWTTQGQCFSKKGRMKDRGLTPQPQGDDQMANCLFSLDDSEQLNCPRESQCGFCLQRPAFSSSKTAGLSSLLRPKQGDSDDRSVKPCPPCPWHGQAILNACRGKERPVVDQPPSFSGLMKQGTNSDLVRRNELWEGEAEWISSAMTLFLCSQEIHQHFSDVKCKT